jgi:hypothetical protein
VIHGQAEERPISGKARKDTVLASIAFRAREFNKILELLGADMETIRGVYGESANQIYGKSQFVVPLSNLLLAQLERLHAIAANRSLAGTPQHEMVFEWLSTVQKFLIELHIAAFSGGDESPLIPSRLADLAIYWNSESSQKVLDYWLGSVNEKNDLRVLLAFLDTFRKIPAAGEIVLTKVSLAGGLAQFGNGEARCSIDLDGEYCYVDLEHQYLGTVLRRSLARPGHS